MTEETHPPVEEDEQLGEELILYIEKMTLAMMEHMGIDPTDPKNHEHMDENRPGSEINTYKELAMVAFDAVINNAERIAEASEKVGQPPSFDLLDDFMYDSLDNRAKTKEEPQEDKHPEGYNLSSTINAYIDEPSGLTTLGAVRRLVADMDAIDAPDSTVVTGGLDVAITHDLLAPHNRGYFIECGDCGAKDVLVQSHECEYEE